MMFLSLLTEPQLAYSRQSAKELGPTQLSSYAVQTNVYDECAMHDGRSGDEINTAGGNLLHGIKRKTSRCFRESATADQVNSLSESSWTHAIQLDRISSFGRSRDQLVDAVDLDHDFHHLPHMGPRSPDECIDLLSAAGL